MTESHLRHRRILAATLLLVIATVAACRPTTRPSAASPAARGMAQVIVPAPVSLTLNGGEPYRLDSASSIVVTSDAEVARTGEMLAARLRASTGYAIPVRTDPVPVGAITLRLNPAAAGEEYQPASRATRFVSAARPPVARWLDLRRSGRQTAAPAPSRAGPGVLGEVDRDSHRTERAAR
jgi:hypothetical protein